MGIEVGVGMVLYLQKNLPFFALDFVPNQPKMVLFEGVPSFYSVDYRNFPESRFISGYFDGLRAGYSFVGALPVSLSRPIRVGLDPRLIHLLPSVYYVVRMLMTFVIVTCLITGFGIQAMWLGAIAALDKKRPT